MNRLLFFSLLLLSGTVAWAQEAADSVVVMGRVVNRLSGEVEPYCRISFLQGADTMASVVSDAAGEFGTDPMPSGSYGLSVTLKGMTLYRADLVLNGNAELTISVITDSFQLRTLREVKVEAPKHMLAGSGQLITSADDPRLWDFTYCDWCLWSGPPRMAAASTSGDPNNPDRRVNSGHFYRAAKGQDDDRIWQLIWPDRVITAPTKEEPQEKPTDK